MKIYLQTFHSFPNNSQYITALITKVFMKKKDLQTWTKLQYMFILTLNILNSYLNNISFVNKIIENQNSFLSIKTVSVWIIFLNFYLRFDLDLQVYSLSNIAQFKIVE